MMDQAHQQI